MPKGVCHPPSNGVKKSKWYEAGGRALAVEESETADTTRTRIVPPIAVSKRSLLTSYRSFRIFVTTTGAGAFGCPTLSVFAAYCGRNNQDPPGQRGSPKFGCEEILHRPLNGKQGRARVGKKSDERNLGGRDIVDLINQTPLGKPNSGHQDRLGMVGLGGGDQANTDKEQRQRIWRCGVQGKTGRVKSQASGPT